MVHSRRCHIYDLADELLNEVLSFLLESQSGPGTGSRALDRASGSGSYRNGVEHHQHQNHPSNDRQPIGFGESSDLDRFRLVCTRFMRISTPRKFSHFNLRFSEDGFRRLNELLQMQLACYVKSVTYLVRPFYQGNGWESILRILEREHPTLAQVHRGRLQEQLNLVSNNTDLTQLRAAVASFSALQELKLLRLQDQADEHLLDFIRDHNLTNETPNPELTIHFDWEFACSRAVTNLGISLLDSQCTSIRFTGPHISPEATLQLLKTPSATFAAMGPRLTSLDITFHSHNDISPTMSNLSTVFRDFFLAAKNLVAIHIGFPSKCPLSLPLDSIFHNIRWKTLRALSLSGWRLNATDLISLLRRHAHQLRDLRLTAIYLRPGSKWSTVLTVLRYEMDRLDRVQLSGLDYVQYFDEVSTPTGVEIFNPIPFSPPSPTSSTVSLAADPSPPASPDLGPSLPAHLLSVSDRQGLPRRGSFEKVRGLTVDELGDDGIHVRQDQERLWEAWVLDAGWREWEGGFGRGDSNGNGNGNGNGFSNGYGHSYGNGNGNGNGIGIGQH